MMEAEEILKLLPHRYPFMLVDRVIECDFKERIVGIKNLTFNEPFFQGHFPGHPVMPGVLQIEAMAQVGGILMNKAMNREGAIAYFTGVNNAKFRRMVIPGDTLTMEVKLLKVKLGIIKAHGETRVGDELACEADMTFSYGRG
ncbi:MAG: 3-hydroxyacyl-ACP dehydratase FabZ [Spartobacteria bacterium]|nr:3-hydroxyacyl-ACP dehydratase FabZ [Spartobacteria bacterium]